MPVTPIAMAVTLKLWTFVTASYLTAIVIVIETIIITPDAGENRTRTTAMAAVEDETRKINTIGHGEGLPSRGFQQ